MSDDSEERTVSRRIFLGEALDCARTITGVGLVAAALAPTPATADPGKVGLAAIIEEQEAGMDPARRERRAEIRARLAWRREVGDNPYFLKNGYEYRPEDWDKNVETINQAIDRSRRKRNILMLVDKAARELHLYIHGEWQRAYIVEFGLMNPYTDKMKQGDHGTPEGVYPVTHVKAPHMYHKALQIGYPNQHDWAKFRTRKWRGDIPDNAKIGGAIQIHGLGSGTGQYDLTEGCVAMANDDIDDLFARTNPRRNQRRLEVVIVRYGLRADYRLTPSLENMPIL